MNPIRIAIERPIAVVAVVCMAVMFGAIALLSIPIQLTPDVKRPQITVTTNWAGAAPAEIEREIVNKQEEELAGLGGVVEMTSSSSEGRGSITLEFEVGHNIWGALNVVGNRLDRVTGYPDEADEPRYSRSGDSDPPIAWFTISRSMPSDEPIHQLGDLVENTVKERLDRVPGVGNVSIFGGSERELQVIVRPQDLARYQLTVNEVANALRNASVSVSAGDVEEGKRRYIVRTEGEIDRPEQILNVVLRSSVDPVTGRLARLTIADLADVRVAYKEPTANIRVLGEPALAARVTAENDANVIETMEGIKATVAELKTGVLADAGLVIEQRYDQTTYIDSAIELVLQNIYVGGALAALILLLFLRSLGATLIVSVAIPVSVIASFVAMAAMGRSINVISLAGLAFAVGMVVDAAIVVLENIYRLRQAGYSRTEAAYQGAAQVWGAVFVSALTTVMVFIPILTMELEVGQLFRDIAVAISVSVVLSLIVAVTLIPAMGSRLLGRATEAGVSRIQIPVVDHFASAFRLAILSFTRRIIAYRAVAFLFATGVAVLAGTLAYTYMPKLGYLPSGNRNLVFGVINPPPGYNLDTMTEIAERVEDETRHLWQTEGAIAQPDGPPLIKHFFFVARTNSTFLGASSVDPERTRELIPPMQEPIFSEPGTFGFIRQPSLFGRGFGGGNQIDLNVSGQELEEIMEVASRAMGRVAAVMPTSEGHQFRPNPGLELGAPEVRLIPDRVRLADAGVTASEFARSVDAFNDGFRVMEVSDGSEIIDMRLMGPEVEGLRTQGIGALPIVTGDGKILPAQQLARIEVTAGPTAIRHVERLRTVTIGISVADGVPLQAAIETIETEVIQALKDEGLPAGITMRLSGTSDKLAETFNAMKTDLLLALVIVFLVMAILFESFLYPLVIMVSVPVAAAGGVGGLAVLNAYLETQTPPKFQSLDMLTMLGFVILIGIVVNNAILLVHQALHHVRVDGMAPKAAILEATDNRLRPIFMSSITSIVGMLPLVIVPGAGSELYRGLGSVVVGGLSLSALLTLLLIPPLLSCVLFERSRRPEPQSIQLVPKPLPEAAE